MAKNERNDKDAAKVAAKSEEDKPQPKTKATGDVFQVEMEDAKGKKQKLNFRIRPGVPSIRFQTKPVRTEALTKLANGQDLSDPELTESPTLRGVTKEDALLFLEECIAKGAYWII